MGHLKVKRQDYLTALFTYFDMLFTHGRGPVILSTGPESEATHWRQMIFCLKEDLVVEKEDIVVGEMKVQLATPGGWISWSSCDTTANGEPLNRRRRSQLGKVHLISFCLVFHILSWQCPLTMSP